jgi:hypothetical protein
VSYKPNQRLGSVSNSHVGAEFELTAQRYFDGQGVKLTQNHSVQIGIGPVKKPHKFDLGSSSPAIIVECKSHRWTTGDNVPSAKMSVWNEVMFYFSVAPSNYRKILFVLHDYSAKRKESLLGYYLRTYSHLIPNGVELLEFDESSNAVVTSKRIGSSV